MGKFSFEVKLKAVHVPLKFLLLNYPGTLVEEEKGWLFVPLL
ncbi:hypothetical protein [Bacillus salipaludis]|uniref:Uncharacterized protein n=1 Tax=Bacillus salipaludis TaxID=2547811 RepID=A0AA90QTG8_9BACI|nr:hypothetical protein [Bacillus salipaludis]MDQ6597932.1 hypothetical protein [Bacillus salipaludis]